MAPKILSSIVCIFLLLWLMNERRFGTETCLADGVSDLERVDRISGNFEREICLELHRIRNSNAVCTRRHVGRIRIPQILWTKHGHLRLWLPDISLYHNLELNPGSVEKKSKCMACNKTVRTNQIAIVCENCSSCFHAKCVGLTKENIQRFSNSVEQWLCITCSLSQFNDSFLNPLIVR